MADRNDTYATRRISYRDAEGVDRSIPKGADLTQLKPEIPPQQIDDWRHAGMVGAKDADTIAGEAEDQSATDTAAKATAKKV